MQNWINKNSKLILPLGLIVFIAMGALYVYFIVLDNPKPKVTDFDSCVEANDGIISMIYPPRCTYEGVTYFQDTELELDNPKPKVTDFDSCVEANDGIISTIYPPRCTYEGVTYFQDTELELDESTSAGVDDSGSGTNFLDNETILGEPVE